MNTTEITVVPTGDAIHRSVKTVKGGVSGRKIRRTKALTAKENIEGTSNRDIMINDAEQKDGTELNPIVIKD
jgi:hypothetical protein